MKEIEKAGLPVVQLCNIIPVALSVGANRIVPTVSIPYPLGDPSLTKEQQYKVRRRLVERALYALTEEIEDQTVFKVER